MKTITLKNENIVHVVEEYDIPRYEMRVRDDCYYECEMTVEEIKDCCKLYVPRGDYSHLTTFEINYDDLTGKTLEEDREIFQKKLDEAFGKDMYEAFVLGAYIHSGTSFSISKTGDHRCRFDSSQLGFIGVPKGMNPDEIAEELTAAWNGEYQGYEIYDNLLDDYVDSICDYDYKSIEEWKEEARKKYGVEIK